MPLRQGFGAQAHLRQDFGAQAHLRQDFGAQAHLRQDFGAQAHLRKASAHKPMPFFIRRRRRRIVHRPISNIHYFRSFVL